MVGFVEALPGSRLNLSTLHAHLRERLAPYKCPQHLFIIKELPTSPTGKILKAGLGTLAEQLIKQDEIASKKSEAGERPS